MMTVIRGRMLTPCLKAFSSDESGDTISELARRWTTGCRHVLELVDERLQHLSTIGHRCEFIVRQRQNLLHLGHLPEMRHRLRIRLQGGGLG